MNYIVLDLEWNQALSPQRMVREPFKLGGEIIQFGAVKIDNLKDLNIVERFSEIVRPVFYTKVHKRVNEVTELTDSDLASGRPFKEVCAEFLEWCGDDYAFITWGEADIYMLEDRLGEILVCLYEESERVKIAREKREAEELRRAEEEKRKRERQERRALEARKTIALRNKANDYRIATEIREYIAAAIENGGDEITLEWINWAQRKADWYDPIVALEDDYLGKREHGKNSEDKALQAETNRNWWW